MVKQNKFTDFFRGFIEDIRKRLIDEGWFQRGLHADLRENTALSSHSFAEQLSWHRPSGHEGPEQQYDHGIEH